MAAALLFWGWNAEFVFFSIVMAVILESPRFISLRWEFSDTELNRVWDLCALLFLGAAAFLYSNEEIKNSAYVFAQWQPFLFFPMMLVQAYGHQSTISVRTFSWFLRKQKNGAWAQKRLNVSWLYFAVCLLGAGATNQPSGWFYPGSAVLIILALWSRRPARVPRWVFIALIGLVAVGGYFGHQQLRELQSRVETLFGNWIAGKMRRGGASAREARTAIGQIGRLKLSGRILLRVEPEKGGVPTLLREATFDAYRSTSWYGDRTFGRVLLEVNDTWRLLPRKKLDNSVVISGYLENRQGLLALPTGTSELENLPVAEVSTNHLGAVRVAEGPGLVSFRARFGPGITYDCAPTTNDMVIPEKERPGLATIVDHLNLAGKTEPQKLKTVAGYFQNNFRYSTFQGRPPPDPTGQTTPLGIFLNQTRSGHCEYFATATVLMLRQAGIPARYAIGYAVMESARNGKQYLVRDRHAHAWTLFWNQDKQVWEDFDTTPGSWDEIENKQASRWESLSDFWSNLWFQFSRWRWGKTNYKQYLIWLLIPLILILAWRILFSTQRKRARANSVGTTLETNWQGADSEFYLIESRLHSRGWPREPHETDEHWVRRVKSIAPAADLDTIVALHYRYRFDPEGMSGEQRAELRQRVRWWLAAEPPSKSRN